MKIDSKDKVFEIGSRLIDVVPVSVMRKKILELVSILNQKKMMALILQKSL